MTREYIRSGLNLMSKHNACSGPISVALMRAAISAILESLSVMDVLRRLFAWHAFWPAFGSLSLTADA